MTLNQADQDFIDKMVPHHQDAVMMAQKVLAHGTDSRVRTLAGSVIKTQTAEIRDMLAWGAKPGSPGTGGPAGMAAKMHRGGPDPVHDEEIRREPGCISGSTR